jgi:hypothetical protein
VLLHLVRWDTRAVRGLHVPDDGGDQLQSVAIKTQSRRNQEAIKRP